MGDVVVEVVLLVDDEEDVEDEEEVEDIVLVELIEDIVELVEDTMLDVLVMGVDMLELEEVV